MRKNKKNLTPKNFLEVDNLYSLLLLVTTMTSKKFLKSCLSTGDH